MCPLSVLALALLLGSAAAQTPSVEALQQAALATVEAIRGIEPGPMTVFHWP